MKIEKIDQTTSTADDTTIPLTLLSHRIEDELYELVSICQNVENALGTVFHTANDATEQPIVAIQGLDRLQQTLEDLARLSKLVARFYASSSDGIPKDDILKSTVLAGLAGRLTKSETIEFGENPDLDDVIWK